jgi:NADPH:quinone reductase-like Zn-dependent oxidoreductase
MRSEGYFLTNYGDSKHAFYMQTFELPELKKEEVLIEVESFGLNYADVMARKKLYKAAPPIPCIIGYDIVGKVIKSTSSDQNDWIGKRVVAFTRFGGYARHAVTSVHSIFEIGDIPSNSALSLVTQGSTAIYIANHLLRITNGDKVLVHAAAGGVGSILAQCIKIQGGNVLGIVSNSEKIKALNELSIDAISVERRKDYKSIVLDYFKSSTIDVSLNAVGGKTIKHDLSLLGSGGRLVSFGGADLSSTNGNFFSKIHFLLNMGFVMPIALMMQSKSILGVNMLKIGDDKPSLLNSCLAESIQLFLNNEIKLLEGTEFHHTNLSEAHLFLESRKSIGKINVYW